MRFIQLCTYWLLAFICCCNYKDQKKIPISKEITSVNSLGSPIHLLNSLLNEHEVGPDKIVATFRADVRFKDWKRHFPEQMMECVAKFPLDSGREMTAEVFTHWAQKSYDQSISYVENKMNDSDLKDSAIIGIVNGLRNEQLSVAVSWAHEISDESIRYQLLESLATQ
jgi:hypothetical protein